MSQNSELIARLRDLSKMLDEYEGGNFKWSEEAATAREAADALQAMEPSELDKTADNNKVICPNCCHQFTAIPVNVQTRLQALERVPMKDFEVIGATATVDATKDGWMMEIVRRIELFHGITPPESNDVLHTE